MPSPRLAILLVLAPLAAPGAAGVDIRLSGEFLMTGRITAAHAVPGERVGEQVTRTWTFTATCPAGQCAVERLVRARATGADQLELSRPAATGNLWSGTGSFVAPLECGSHIDPRGERVFFKIRVRITGSAPLNGAWVATALKASYRSYRRTNRTRCVSALGHDAAVYSGALVIPAPGPPSPTPAPG